MGWEKAEAAVSGHGGFENSGSRSRMKPHLFEVPPAWKEVMSGVRVWEESKGNIPGKEVSYLLKIEGIGIMDT